MKFEIKLFLKKHLYKFIPAICIGLWAMYLLIRQDFGLNPVDFNVFYNSGKIIFKDPSNLYDIAGFYYMPSFCIFMAITFSLLPHQVAIYSFFIFNYILGVLMMLEFDKILKIMNVQERIKRFIYLLVITNGWVVYGMFFYNQTKYLLAFLFILVIRRELHYRKEEKAKDLKFYAINYSLLAFAIGLAPYFIFFLLIYLFNDIKPKETLMKENIKKYLLVVGIFAIQNFLFIIYPNLIFSFLKGSNYLKVIWYFRAYSFPRIYLVYFSMIGIIILLLATLILMFNTKLKIEEKFGFISIFIMLFCIYVDETLLIILIPLILLLFVPFLQKENQIYDFIKSNKYFLIGIISIISINFTIWELNTHFKYFPFLKNSFLAFFIYFRWIFSISIMIICLLLLYIKNSKNLENNH